jgi:hypothetical protein
MTTPRMFVALLTAALLLPVATGCKKKAVEPETSGVQRTPRDVFADDLAAAEFVRYSVDIGDGGSLTYETLRFVADNTWTGSAVLRLAKEPYSCTESGSWQLEEGSPLNPTTGRLMMVMDSTDCPGRDAQKKWKVEIRLEGGKGGRPEIVDL